MGLLYDLRHELRTFYKRYLDPWWVAVLAFIGGSAVFIGLSYLIDEARSDARLSDELLSNLRENCCDIPKEKWHEFLDCFGDRDSEDKGWKECTFLLQDACEEESESVRNCIDEWVRIYRSQIDDVVRW